VLPLYSKWSYKALERWNERHISWVSTHDSISFLFSLFFWNRPACHLFEGAEAPC
jgi:hypothetical protein